MKVAFIVPSLAKKGPIKVVHELVKQYLKMGIVVNIFYFDEIKGFSFPCDTVKIDFLKGIKFDDFDIVHSHGIRPDAYIFYHKNDISYAKCVTTLHNYVKKDLAYQYNFLISIIFSFIWNLFTIKHDAIVVLSRDAKKYYMSFWKNKNIFVIYNGIDIPEIVHRSCVNNCYGEINLGVVGLLTKTKGFDQVINVLSFNKNYRLTIIGDGKEREGLESLAKSLKVESQVAFLGYVPGAIDNLELFDIFLMTSRAEGFPLALLEAASIKKAIVCSNIAIHQEIFSSSEVSFFELENIESLHVAIEYALKNKCFLGQNSYSKFTTFYTSKIMAKNYVNLYMEFKNE
jgi:L-malate glycosyltransferase